MSKVVHLTSVHPRYDIRIFLKECRGLAANRHEVNLVVADGLGDACIDSIRIHDVGRPSGRINRILQATNRVFRRAIQLDADLYHLHDPELMPVGLWLKYRGKKVIFDAHEDVPKQLLAKHYLHPVVRHLSSHIATWFERYACPRFDGIVTATPYIRDKFLRLNPRSVDVNNFPRLGELESRVPWKDRANEVCYVGSIAQVRGVKELVRAMEATRTPVRLNLVGSFAEAQVESEVKKYPGWSKVNARGVLERAGVREVLGRSVAGVVTLHPAVNYLDALPIKMFEYMSAGIPVIASNFPLWKQILESSQCGICVDPLDPLAIARAIDELIENPLRAQQMGQNGRRLVESKFNWSLEESKLVKFYDQLLSA